MTEVAPPPTQIDTIVRNNRDAFAAWRKTQPKKISLPEIPDEVLPALIPQRAYELASDPGAVRIIKCSSITSNFDKKVLSYAVVQSTNENVTDPGKWKEYRDTEATTNDV